MRRRPRRERKLDVSEATFRAPYLGPDGHWWRIDAEGNPVPAEPPWAKREPKRKDST
jgi:hypothetical protein